ncbi:hypothetical protein BS50DRAFT_569879 [Corynespora cassiicola Philippines]|uniref:Uncharacterized protein n=1 Tax=Corynespora cassiicola Philippines TaxID=1448308 RepID=A0A2T2P422_CORCC|nr:hypothetical protein BS50DRAFT_569879 [Corynespora cassiicola Philippines]
MIRREWPNSGFGSGELFRCCTEIHLGTTVYVYCVVSLEAPPPQSPLSTESTSVLTICRWRRRLAVLLHKTGARRLSWAVCGSIDVKFTELACLAEFNPITDGHALFVWHLQMRMAYLDTTGTR